MAARTASTRSRRTTKKAEPAEEIEDDDLDVEVEDEDEEEEPAPKKRAAAKKPPAKKVAPAAKAKAEKEVFGSAWLKEHVNDTLNTDHESTKLRIVLRKLIKDGTIDSPKDGRYIFTGPRDPNVKAVIAALREEAKAGPAKRGRKPKAKQIAEEDDSDEDVEDLDLDDEE